jgi:hypothetical protein
MTATMTDQNKAERMPRAQGNKQIMPDVTTGTASAWLLARSFSPAGGFNPNLVGTNRCGKG